MGFGFKYAARRAYCCQTEYGERLGLKGNVASPLGGLNPHPTLIPAIESGWVEQIHSSGRKWGLDTYIRLSRRASISPGPTGPAIHRARAKTPALYDLRHVPPSSTLQD